MNRFLSLIIALTATTVSMAQGQHLVGGDLSLLPSYERYSTPYLDAEGTPIDDVVNYLHETCHWNAVRLRLFVEPRERSSNVHTGVVQDVDYILPLAVRVKEAGMQLMIDFHYSDCWADPSYQEIPRSWQSDTSTEALADSVYSYTYRSLSRLVDAGACPDYVQIGNEISYGMLWRNDKDKVYPSKERQASAEAWDRLSTLLNSGSRAVREACPEAKIMIHTERTVNANQTVNYYNCIGDVDYDCIALSYYPFWHGNLSTLSATLEQLHLSHPQREVQIVETAYYYQWYPADATYNFTDRWPATPQGQQSFAHDLIELLQQYPNVNGLYWWFPEENGNGGASYNAQQLVIDSWLNRGLWDDNTHRALPALSELQTFLTEGASLSGVDAGLVDSQSEYYNLQGIPVEHPTKGLYIRQHQIIALP